MDDDLEIFLNGILDEELDEEELIEFEKALDRGQIEELKDSLKIFDKYKDDLSDEVKSAVEKLVKLVTELVGYGYPAKKPEEEEEEEEKPGKVKKGDPWSFTFSPHDED